jgi:hypothetical protein
VRVGNLNPTTLAFQFPSAGHIYISPSLHIANSLEPSNLRPGPTVPTTSTPNYEDLSKTAVDYTPFHRFPYIDLYKEPVYQLAANRYNLVTIPGTKVFNHTFEGTQLSQLVKNGLVLASNTQANRLDIDRGNALVAPDKEVVIGTHEAEIHIAPGAVVFVMEDGADVVLYGLSQNNSKQVSVILNANKHQLFLEPGLMLVLTRQDAHKFEDIDADCHYVSYRNAKMLDIDEKDIKVFMANFSTSSAVVNIEPLQQMLASSDQKDKSVLDQIAKSAVIMGGFHTQVEPPSTQIASKQPRNGSAADSQNNSQAATAPMHPSMQIGTSGQVTR